VKPGTQALVSIYVRRYRQNNPKSRVESPYKIVRNTGCRREYESLVDGSRVSMCNKYPITKRVMMWMREQEAEAAKAVLRWAEEDGE
jgi:hypothetical protein